MLDFDTKTIAIVGTVLGVGVIIGTAYFLMQTAQPQEQGALPERVPVPEDEELPSNVTVVTDEDFIFEIRVTKGMNEIEHASIELDHLAVDDQLQERLCVLYGTDNENVYVTVYFEDVIVSIAVEIVDDAKAESVINRMIDRFIVRLEELATDFTTEDKEELRGTIIALFSF